MFDPADPSDPADPGGGIGSFLETGMVMGLDGPLTGKNWFLFLQEKDKERDAYGWLLCTSRSGHDPDKLMPTQIIAGNVLECMGHLVHSYRKQWNIVQFCDCAEALESNKSIQANSNSANTNATAGSNGSNGSSNGSSNANPGGSNGNCKVRFILLLLLLLFLL